MADTATEEPDAPPPSDDLREALLADFVGHLGDGIADSHLKPGDDLWIRVNPDAWGAAAETLRHKMGCQFFDFVSAIDWMPSPYGREMDAEVDTILAAANVEVEAAEAAPIVQGYAGGETRFQVFGRAINVVDKWGITIKADVPEDTLSVPTWINTYPGAAWHEREVHEMFGVSFDGNVDMRKLYLPTDFEGYPMRKDFPLLARRVKPWPGIVDVEGMPGDDDEEEAAESATEGASE